MPQPIKVNSAMDGLKCYQWTVIAAKKRDKKN